MKKFKYRGYDSASVEQIGTLEAENYSEGNVTLHPVDASRAIMILKKSPRSNLEEFS